MNFYESFWTFIWFCHDEVILKKKKKNWLWSDDIKYAGEY